MKKKVWKNRTCLTPDFLSVLNSRENILSLELVSDKSEKISYPELWILKFENLGQWIHELRDRMTVALLRNRLLNKELWLVTGT